MSDVASLLGEIERLGDARARDTVRALVAGVLELHRAGLAPLVDALREQGDGVLRAQSRNPAVASILLLHGLHPVDPVTRAREALEVLAPKLRAVNATARLDPENDGALRIHLDERTPGRTGAAALVEAALSEAVPDVTVVVDTVTPSAPESLLPVSRLTAKRGAVRASDEGEKEVCDLCGQAIRDDHDHLLDVSARDLRCACRACASLFGAGSGRWRRVPHRVERLRDVRMDDDVWAALGIPIDLAFFFRSTSAARIIAMYPGPAGATESTLSLDAWSRVEADNPALRDLAADVEALLVRRTRAGCEHYRVSIDACFALAGRIRKHWKGLGGGQEAWAQIAAFFTDLDAASERVAHA